MKALITGILGQDGSFLAELLYKKNYKIYGVVKKNTDDNRIKWLMSLIPNVIILKEDITDKDILYKIIKNIMPDVIYNFAAHSNVFNPWEDLSGIFEVNSKIPQNILEFIIKIDKNIKFFQASSCLVFGKDDSKFQNEETKSNPIHPYGITKLYADNMIKEVRNTFGIYCCSGIFFNHESERRQNNFFSRKITTEIAKIKCGKSSELRIGDLSSLRDYGYAKDYMEAVYLMMTQDNADDFVIGTGNIISMMDFVKKCFEYTKLDFNKYIVIDKSLYRSNDTKILRADITKIKNDLGWTPKHSIDDIISIMMKNDIKNNN